MREILGFFFNLEESIEGLLVDQNKQLWKSPIRYTLQIALLSSLLFVLVLQVGGVQLQDMGPEYKSLLSMQGEMNQGLLWLLIAGVNFLYTIIAMIIKGVTWFIMLCLTKIILKRTTPYYSIFLITIYSVLIGGVGHLAMLVGNMLASLISVGIIQDILMGITSIMAYWYLAILALGISAMMDYSFFKGLVIVIVIVGVLSGLSHILPFLQVALI